jgi:hypothetical protein
VKEQPDKSAIAEKSISLGHHIQLHNTSILSTKPRYMDRIIREVINIELQPNNLNTQNGFCLCKLWKPLKTAGNLSHTSLEIGSTLGYTGP